MTATRILLLPGWKNSGPGHWQTRWEAEHRDQRVEQHDWMRPLRGDWMAQLEQAVLAADAPVLLAAHSMGCLLLAAWAAHSRHTRRVRGALLVAPGDLERDDLRQQIPGWAPIERGRLPFRATLVASRNDPYCTFKRAEGLARSWGADLVDLGQCGHINAESGLGGWPQGRQWLSELIDGDQVTDQASTAPSAPRGASGA